jgi:hypothetical protein
MHRKCWFGQGRWIAGLVMLVLATLFVPAVGAQPLRLQISRSPEGFHPGLPAHLARTIDCTSTPDLLAQAHTWAHDWNLTAAEVVVNSEAALAQLWEPVDMVRLLYARLDNTLVRFMQGPDLPSTVPNLLRLILLNDRVQQIQDEESDDSDEDGPPDGDDHAPGGPGGRGPGGGGAGAAGAASSARGGDASAGDKRSAAPAAGADHAGGSGGKRIKTFSLALAAECTVLPTGALLPALPLAVCSKPNLSPGACGAPLTSSSCRAACASSAARPACAAAGVHRSAW